LDVNEKVLYHQIHPLKLAADIISAFVSLFLLWIHDLVLGLIVGYVPSVIATVLIISFADLEKYKQSTFGKYVKTYMNRTMQAVRLAGDTLSKIAAWYNIILLIIISMLMILLAWLRGKLFPAKRQ
jgi:hypothetical protein